MGPGGSSPYRVRVWPQAEESARHTCFKHTKICEEHASLIFSHRSVWPRAECARSRFFPEIAGAGGGADPLCVYEWIHNTLHTL